MAYQYPTYIPGQVIYPGQQVTVPAPAGQLEQLRAAQAYQMQQVPQTQPASTGIIWVQGEEGAKAYMVAPGASVMLMDAEGQAFYIKSADASGMPMPLRIFDYTERMTMKAPERPVESVQVPAVEYVTRSDFDALRRQVDALAAIPAPEPITATAQQIEQPPVKQARTKGEKKDEPAL